MLMAHIPAKILPALRAPGESDATDLVERDGALLCPQTGKVYAFDGGVARLMVPGGSDVGRRASLTQDGLEEFGELVTWGSRNPTLRGILRIIGANKRVLDCGCGSGQRSNFLQLNNNQVLGVDTSIAELQWAVAHKEHNQLTRVAFAQMDPFDPAVKDGSMDVVLAFDLLPWAERPNAVLRTLSGKARVGGLVVFGLFSAFVFGAVPSRDGSTTVARHTLGRALRWLDECDLEFVSCNPPILGTAGEGAPPFTPSTRASAYERAVTELSWSIWNRANGGLFHVVGRKRS